MDSDSSNYPLGHAPSARRREPARAEVGAPHAMPPHAQDYWRVNLAEDWEVTFWTREFGCSESQLKAAVNEVGDNAGRVRARLLDENQQRRN